MTRSQIMKAPASCNPFSASRALSARIILALSLLANGACRSADADGQPPVVPDGDANKGKKIIAKTYNSGFALGHDSYNAMGTGSDGRIYYVLSSDNIDQGAKMFCFDPKTEQIKELGDLTEACGEKGSKAIPQGRSHVNFVEVNGKLYFATHVGVYSIVQGKETMGIPPAGYKPYPGGHLLSYDLKTGRFEDYGIAPGREGVLTFNMDKKRGRLFALTWPSGIFYRYDLATKEPKDFGRMCAKGEDGVGTDYRTVCRSIVVDQQDGSAYFTTSEGTIFRYDPATDRVAPVEGEDMKKDYFGLYDPTNPGHMGYNWRQTFWRPSDGLIYGVHGNSGYLFRFDPRVPRIEVLDRITSEPSKRCGMFDQFSYGYLGFALGPDGNTIHYLTGGPIYIDGKRLAGKAKTAMGEAKGLEDLHLVTYDIETGTYTDHGAVFYENGQRPLYVNAITIGKDGMVYTLPRITENGKTRSDLVAFPGPLKAPKDQSAETSGNLVPLILKLPTAAFKGTPKDIQTNSYTEPYDPDKVRPPMMVPAGLKNLAAGSKITCSDTNLPADSLTKLTDGDKDASEQSIIFMRKGTQWVQLDLGRPCEPFALVIWHAHNTAKVYHDVLVRLSDDPAFTENVRTLFNNDQDNTSGLGVGTDREYFETHEGKLINAEGKIARYVRFYSKGSTESALNEYTEVEVYGRPAK